MQGSSSPLNSTAALGAAAPAPSPPSAPPVAPASSSAAAAPAPSTGATSISSKNSATQRKVAKLLDITTSSEIKDLASYVDAILPGYIYNATEADHPSQQGGKGVGSSGKEVPDAVGLAVTASAGAGSGTVAGSQQQAGARAVTSTALRLALDHRAIDLHKSFLQEFRTVYDHYQRVAAQVNALQDKCAGLEETWSGAAGAVPGEADDFFYKIQMHQAELQLVQHHEKEVDEFRKQHHFGPAEQQVLEEGPVDMNFLNVLERAREVHLRSSELMQSQEYHQGAAAVMESTYAAIARATEKITRHLLATANTTTASGHGSNGSGGADRTAVGSIAADVPEVTGFQLRCVRLLYEESPSLHEKFLDEVARLRRASVLRRYFHLLTTGSANTATGLYQSGGQSTLAEERGGGIGARPLEAELNNPAYFFSSLCAWLHQTIVEEQDFLHNFFVSDEAETQAGRRGSSGAGANQRAAVVVIVDAERVKQDAARQQSLLDSVFGGVCKHIRAALDNVLERLGRTASALGANNNSGVDNTGNSSAAGNKAAEEVDTAGTQRPYKGTRLLSSGLTRLFMAATGRTPAGTFHRRATEEANTLVQRYASVTTRAQQEAVASSILHPPLQGVQTCVTLVQLFEYYTATTFEPLLGPDAALTQLIRDTAPQQTQELFQRLLRVLAAHLLDSTAGVISRTATLRRLASSNALSQAAASGETPSSAQDTTASSAAKAKSSTYILDFLVSMTYGEDGDGATATNASVMGASLNDSLADFSASTSSVSLATSNAKFKQANDGQLQRHSAQELKRVLLQLILPPSPEVTAYCGVLHAVLRDTARQADLLQAIAEQHRLGQEAAAASGAGHDGDDGFHTKVKGFVCEMLQALWRTAQSVQEEGTLRAHLDDPCRAILEYNVVYQLQQVFEQHDDVLELLCQATEVKPGTAASTHEREEVDMRQLLDTLRAESGAAMNALRRRLLAEWQAAIVHFYFPISTEAVAAAAVAAASNAGAGAAKNSEAEEQRHIAVKRDVRRVLKQFASVYNTVASMGHLPEPVPLLPALCGDDKVRSEVSVDLTKSLVQRVYPAEFSALQHFPPDEELHAVQREMSPENLAVLVDFRSPASASPV